MGIPAAPLIAAGASLLGAGANAYSSGRTNKKTREWNDKQYYRTRQDALADYNMQNTYNSPAAQMQRYREAGLNPNLIYGQSNEAAPVRSSETPSWNPRAPEFNLDAGPAISAYFQTKMQDAQLRNMETVNTVQQQEAILKGAQTQATLAGIPGTQANTAKTLWDTQFGQQNAPYLLEMSRKNIEKLSAETNQLVDNNERQAALTANTLQQGLENILLIRLNRAKTEAETQNLKQALKNLETDNELKQEDLQLKKLGINPSDPAWQRKLGQMLEKLIPKGTTIKSRFPGFINDIKIR